MLNGVAMMVAASYLGAVIWAGRLDDLLSLLSKEVQFVEWSVAVAALLALRQSETIGPVGRQLSNIAFIGLAFQVASNRQIQDAFKRFAAGDVDFLTALKGDKITVRPLPQKSEKAK